MEVIFHEDPACHWCWAFQPIETTFLFELGETLPPRRLMGGLRDHPFPDASLGRRQWEPAMEISDMPFEPAIWQRHLLRTTHLACSAVKAVALGQPSLADRFLRRLREAYFTECVPIDDLTSILEIARATGVEIARFEDHLASGRARAFFNEDRRRASYQGFGFPTIVLRPRSPRAGESEILLEGLVPYEEILAVLEELGVPQTARRRFVDRPADWERLFTIRERLTLAELRHVTGLDDAQILRRLDELGCAGDGMFFRGPALFDGIDDSIDAAEMAKPMAAAANLA
ncbi:MAG TPA: DsbA family protein [Planctomycetota bacterium]|nr:DsbA family protein [Planctomycetota bacterium]